MFEFCAARCGDTTEWTELKLQVFRSARDQTHSRVIHCPLPVASVSDFGSGCLGLHGICRQPRGIQIVGTCAEAHENV